MGDGSRIDVNFIYAVQDQPRGLADAFILGDDFISTDSVCLVLGDNVFYGHNYSGILRQAKYQAETPGAAIFGYPAKNPEAFGVVEFNADHRVISIEEKPEKPKSNYAVPGLYFYNNEVVEIAKHVQPSSRGEIEITSINNEYLRRGQLCVTLMGRGMVWLDTSSPKGMYKASEFVKMAQKMQGFYISCIEEIACGRAL